jgi:hypothetical protein
VPQLHPTQTISSKDGRWRTFHKHAGLMQFVPSGVYFARAKVNGKIFRRSLETDGFTAVKAGSRARERARRPLEKHLDENRRWKAGFSRVIGNE